MVLLLYFVLLLWLFRRIASVLTIILGLFITSLIAAITINYDIPIESAQRAFNILYMALILTIIILPFNRFTKINSIGVTNRIKLKRLTYFLFLIGLLMLIVFSVIAVLLVLHIEDINEYKYAEGVMQDTLMHLLPINYRFYSLAQLLFPFSYFLIPLHFYYALDNQKKLSLLAFFFSLTIVLYGFTFFSRWTIIHYVLIYFTFLFLFKDSLSKSYYFGLRRMVALLTAGLVYWFIHITFIRFDLTSSYAAYIPMESPIQNPSLYNAFEYYSQWYKNGLLLLERYDYQTLQGQASFRDLVGFFNRVTPFNIEISKNYWDIRETLMGQYARSFTGLVANWVFDFGYFLTFVVALLFNRIISKIKPRNGRMKITDLLLFSLLVQIPLFSVFYSFIGGIVLSVTFWVFIRLYLNYKV